MVLWGTDLSHIVECFVLGVTLQRTSSHRRIAYLAADTWNNGLSELLRSLWEIRRMSHADIGANLAARTNRRMLKVWSKLQVWALLDSADAGGREFETVQLLDTDLLVMHSMDPNFQLLVNAGVAASYRGIGDFSLVEPRHPSTLKVGTSRRGGGVNGGVVVLKPGVATWEQMRANLLSDYVPPPGCGAEQDFITEWFGMDMQIQPLDLMYNYQVHQFAITALRAREDSRWLALARRRAQVAVWHYSATPKPSHLLLGVVNARTSAFPLSDQDQDFLNNPSKNVYTRCLKLGMRMFEHHSTVVGTEGVREGNVALFQNLTVEALQMYCRVFFAEAWPQLLGTLNTGLLPFCPGGVGGYV